MLGSGGVTTTYAYDGLDQPTGKNYSDSTPPVTYTYSTDWLTAATTASTVVRHLACFSPGGVDSTLGVS